VVNDLRMLAKKYPKLEMPERMLQVFASPPSSPNDCVFSKITTCVSADLEKKITPCQFGGDPDCANCGCLASAGFGAISRYRLPTGLSVGKLFDASIAVGNAVNRLRSHNGVKPLTDSGKFFFDGQEDEAVK
jgi:hypothetical protein